MSWLFLHGFTGSPPCWDDVIAPGAQVGVTRPALLGHAAGDGGIQDHPAGEGGGASDVVGSFDDEVDRLAALASPGVLVAGYSLGARVALRLLLRHPGLARAALLIAPHPGLSDDERAPRLASDARWAELLLARGITAFVDAWEAQPLFATQARLPAVVRQRHRDRRLAHDPRGLARALAVLGLGVMPAAWDAAAGVSVPVTVLAGADDARFVDLGTRLARCLPRGQFTAVAGAGHDVVLERPDAVRAALQALDVETRS